MSFEQIVVASGNYLTMFLVLVTISTPLVPMIKRVELFMFGDSSDYPPTRAYDKGYSFAITTHMFFFTVTLILGFFMAVVSVKNDLADFIIKDLLMIQHAMLMPFAWGAIFLENAFD